MNLAEHMTRAERIQRIGQLLAKGVTLLLLREEEERRAAESQGKVMASGTSDNGFQRAENPASTICLSDDEQRILDYLKRVRRASPRDMQSALELSKATLFRRLKRLTEAKLVVGSGSTTAIRYRLAEPGVEKVRNVAGATNTVHAGNLEL